MDSSALQEVKSLSETAVTPEVKEAEQEKHKPGQILNSKIGTDAERSGPLSQS